MSARAALFTALAFGLAVPLGAQPSITGTEPLRAKAERGNAIAQYNLGLAYAEGRGAAVDPVEAFAWLSLAADAGGNAKALAQLQDKLTLEQIAAGRQRIAALRTEFAALRTPGPAATASPASLAREGPPTPADGAEPSPEAARRALVAELHAARAESAQLRRDLAARSMTRATSAGDIAALEAQLREAQSSLAAQSV
ncbi:MAG TPA: SEL1-like repeat protein, partial [Opitutaceae bacterium]